MSDHVYVMRYYDNNDKNRFIISISITKSDSIEKSNAFIWHHLDY